MTTNNWNRTEEMAQQHDQKSSLWLRLANDGDNVVVVFLGEPFPREVCFLDGKYVPFDDALGAKGHKPSLRVAMNIALLDTQEVKIFEQGVTFFKDLVRVRDKYGLEKWAFEVTRQGAAKDPKTSYTILPERQLTAEERRALARLELHDLEALYEEGPRRKDAPIDADTQQALVAALKQMPRHAVERFCAEFAVDRIRDLTQGQADAAWEFITALSKELAPEPAVEVDPFA